MIRERSMRCVLTTVPKLMATIATGWDGGIKTSLMRASRPKMSARAYSLIRAKEEARETPPADASCVGLNAH